MYPDFKPNIFDELVEKIKIQLDKIQEQNQDAFKRGEKLRNRVSFHVSMGSSKIGYNFDEGGLPETVVASVKDVIEKTVRA